MYQNFCKSLGYGAKGYYLLNKDFKSKKKTILISGSKQNYKYLISKLTKIFKAKPRHIIIKKERFDLNTIDNLFKKNKDKKFDAIVVLGGGSIIDFSKRLVLKYNKQKKKVNFYVFPSLLGSGAEISITSIINTPKEKNFAVNEKFLPDGVIYDENLIKTADKVATLMGIMDSFTHCIESVTSINKNYYLNFLCNETLNSFSKKNFFNFAKRKKDFNYLDIATLSFNGGLAQSNSGSGICHALAHSSEKILNVKHSESISFFIVPVIKYLLIKNKGDLNNFNDRVFKYIFKNVKFLKKNHNFDKLKSLIKNNKSIFDLINRSQNDICWRLYNQNVDVNLLIKCLKNENN